MLTIKEKEMESRIDEFLKKKNIIPFYRPDKKEIYFNKLKQNNFKSNSTSPSKLLAKRTNNRLSLGIFTYSSQENLCNSLTDKTQKD